VLAPEPPRPQPALIAEPAPEPPRARPEAAEVIRASPAGILRRGLAWLVDAALVALVIAAYLKVAQGLMHHPPAPTNTTGLDFLVNRIDAYQGIIKYGLMLGAVVILVYSSLFHALGGRTPGKRLAGIRLVDGTGRPPALWVCLMRAGFSLVSAGALTLGFALALFTRRRRALHDALSGTYVVRVL
jgi:uncharacterized RDD family membrane protein YckC